MYSKQSGSLSELREYDTAIRAFLSGQVSEWLIASVKQEMKAAVHQLQSFTEMHLN